MSDRRPYLGGGITLAIGLALGAILAGGGRPAPLLAGAGDHPDAAIVATGAIGVEVDRNKMTHTKDAVFYLNYSRGRLLAAVPNQVQTATSRQTLTDFGERDLVADFGLEPRQRCHFLMSSGTIGAANGGQSLLYVFETMTGQMAVYQIRQQFTAVSATSPLSGSNRPVIELIERRADPRLSVNGSQVAALPAH